MLESLRCRKSPLKARFRHKLLKGLSFCAKWLFKVCLSSKWVFKTYYKIICVQILIQDQNNFPRVTLEPIKPFKASVYVKRVKHLDLARSEFLRFVESQNESLRLIIIYYVKIYIWDLNNFATFISEPKNPSKASI